MSKFDKNGPTGIYDYKNYNRPLTSYELKNASEISVLYEYRRLKELGGNNIALQELLERHDKLLRLIAKRANNSHNLFSDFDDKLQHLRYGAMRSYDKFDIIRAEENKYKLYNYVSNCASMYLYDANDHDNYINCPPNTRVIRSYLSGRYDNDLKKKNSVERQLGIRDDSDVFHLRQKHIALISDYISISQPTNLHESVTLDDVLEDVPSFNIDTQIYLSQLISTLSSVHQNVFRLVFIDGGKIRDVSVHLGMTEAAVRFIVFTIRKNIKKSISADNLLV
jgi:RNA polymerase sigma factor (sigma-70 family)